MPPSISSESPNAGNKGQSATLGATDSMVLKAGSRLGAYEIIAPLGAGGMGEVYGPATLAP